MKSIFCKVASSGAEGTQPGGDRRAITGAAGRAGSGGEVTLLEDLRATTYKKGHEYPGTAQRSATSADLDESHTLNYATPCLGAVILAMYPCTDEPEDV